MSDIPSDPKYIQNEEVVENSPLSESLLQKAGGSINWIIDNLSVLAVGSLDWSFLSPAQYQSLKGVGWVLADGSSASGSAFETLTGLSTVPDLRGRYTRGKNNGRSDGRQNPDGDLAIAAFQDQMHTSHNHTTTTTNSMMGWVDQGGGSFIIDADGGSDVFGVIGGAFGEDTITVTVLPNSGSETVPKSVIMNVYIRIN